MIGKSSSGFPLFFFTAVNAATWSFMTGIEAVCTFRAIFGPAPMMSNQST